jgi:hypothetical protein
MTDCCGPVVALGPGVKKSAIVLCSSFAQQFDVPGIREEKLFAYPSSSMSVPCLSIVSREEDLLCLLCCLVSMPVELFRLSDGCEFQRSPHKNSKFPVVGEQQWPVHFPARPNFRVKRARVVAVA